MEYLKLIGILLIVIGFSLRLNSSAVVIISALVTAAVSGLNFNQIFSLLGKSFMANRMVTLFFLTLPMIGIMERHGLKIEAARLVKKIKSITPGKICDAYSFIRELGGIAGIRVQGHVQFVRPLLNPMAQAAASIKHKLTTAQSDSIKEMSSADDNLSNFFSEDLSVVSGGALLIASSMKSMGKPIDITQIIVYAVPSAIIIFILIIIRNHYFDKRLQKSNR